jgi:hypothetical protein
MASMITYTTKDNKQQRNYSIRFSRMQNTYMTLMLHIRFKSFSVSNIHSTITIENRAYIHVTFLTGTE